jgi:hypothetical protein
MRLFVRFDSFDREILSLFIIRDFALSPVELRFKVLLVGAEAGGI